ncbi:phage/plasmid primase, P4 family [Lactimicrobium massiliense]|uniref:phage/plasmid primase, P4 family n=1 Tax=Lactimicrobium massiliense TaxID=2161814 RepID=UPI000D55FBCF|nr:phage/plasmid primase, P4 family [Lactimicrobium massiliense]
MKVVLYVSTVTGNEKNCLYPYRVETENAEDLKDAVRFDHVCAEYKGNYRNSKNFIASECAVMDCDNDESDNPEDWISPEMLADELEDVAYAITFSRHHMKEKNGRAARPKFHVYFPIQTIYDPDAYKALKEKIQNEYSFFDPNALDAGRFIYGSESQDPIWHEGSMTIDHFLSLHSAERIIHEGSRNSTLSRFAGRVLIRYGDTEKAMEVFREEAAKCDPPLEEDELQTIWHSAKKFAGKVSKQPGYIPPDKYNPENSLKPDDYSDIGQAKVLTREYGNELIYTNATDFLRFDGRVWVEDKQLAVAATVEFLDLQLHDAIDQRSAALEALEKAGADINLIKKGGKTAEKGIDQDDKNQVKLFMQFVQANNYYAFVMKRRDMKYISSALSVSKALLNRDINVLDQNPNLLNTPEGTVDLEKGVAGLREHRAEDLITKITECFPGDKGVDIWNDSLQLFFQNDQELIDYVQLVVGMAAVGKVYQESLIISAGSGANGKSTFWNTIARVLGTYSGKISAEVLTVGNKRNAKPEMAELKGKRLIIASETEEGMRLNTSMVKQLCSTDPIQAEKKYEKPFDFIPTHTLVLYTNHLPRVGANDDGIWRRLIVIPFNAHITGKSDIKNYSDYLYEHAGPAIMTWIIEGAQKAIADNFKWKLPKVVQDAIDEYRQSNDWLGQFLSDCCEVDPSYMAPSGQFYDEYRNYCQHVGEYTRNSADFYSALEKAGFRKKRTKSARFIVGVQLKSEFM